MNLEKYFNLFWEARRKNDLASLVEALEFELDIKTSGYYNLMEQSKAYLKSKAIGLLIKASQRARE